MAKVALLIGVSEYEPGLSPLPAAVKDIEAMQRVLQNPEMGGFAESDIVLLRNPKRQEMEELIETLFANRHKDDLVLLFFSGHGIKDDAGKLYLGTSKTRKTPQGDLVRSSAVSANFVHENMSRSRSRRQVVILDSCFSGAFAEGLSAKDDGTVDIRTQLGGEGRAVLTSSSSTQYSFEQEGEELSLYTRFLIEGIKTGAADQDGDDVVSIDELHEYANRKVREIKPELKPEIYAIREGFKIRLCKVPQGDPHERYKKEVARCGKRGELTIVSRSILDAWRIRLGLSIDVAKALEDEVLEPYRRDFQQKLQQYEQTVTGVLQRDGLINDGTRLELQQLQQLLDLRNEDTLPIEARITAHLKQHKQNLQTYQEAFSEALRQEHTLNESSRSRLQQMQQQLALGDADVAPIEAQITTEVEIYRRNLQQYEQAFLTATQQEYPLTASKRAELQQHQSNLGLSDVEIAPIEAKVTTQIETYHQKLRQYEEAFASATQRKHQPCEATRTQLRQTWQTLDLYEADVKAIETPILDQIETYQAHMRQYERVFVDATEQEYPVSVAKRSELRQRQRTLSLSDEDIAPVENRITTSIEDHLKKLQQYEQVFSDSIQFEFPVSEATREELQRFQQVLELGDEEVAKLEDKVTLQNERDQSQIHQPDTSCKVPQPTEELNVQQHATPKIASKSKIIRIGRQILAGILIAFGSLWALFFMSIALVGAQNGFFVVLAFLGLADIGLYVTWRGVKLIRVNGTGIFASEKMTSSKKSRILILLGILGFLFFILHSLILQSTLNQGSQVNKARQLDAQVTVYNMNEDQEAFYATENKFTSNLTLLRIKVEPETLFYSYKIRNYNSGKSPYAISTATAKVDGLKSYVGGVFLTKTPSNSTETIAILCESQQPSKKPLASPQLVGGSPQCPPGSTKL
jgi:hypothetical protein